MIGTGAYPFRLTMRETASNEDIRQLMAMEPKDLGRLLTKTGTGRCPVCREGDQPMAVHENGVQFACGCCRSLPPLHPGDRSWAACKLCNDQSNVIPLHGGPGHQRLTTEEVEELQRLARATRRAVAR